MPLDLERLRAIARMFDSQHDGEALNAARLFMRVIKKAGLRIEDVICAPPAVAAAAKSKKAPADLRQASANQVRAALIELGGHNKHARAGAFWFLRDVLCYAPIKLQHEDFLWVFGDAVRERDDPSPGAIGRLLALLRSYGIVAASQ